MRNMIRRGHAEQVYAIFQYCILSILAVFTVYPFYYVLITSLTTDSSLMKYPLMLYPMDFTLQAYILMLKDSIILPSMLNSIIYTLGGALYAMILNISCAFSIKNCHVKGMKFLCAIAIFTMFFNGGMIPNYLNIKELGLRNTRWAVILPAGINMFYLILLVNCFRDIPREIEEAATIDGANEFVYLYKILLPLSKATLSVVLLFTMVDRWNSWYEAMLYLRDNSRWPLMYVLRTMIASYETSIDAVSRSAITARSLSADNLKAATVIVAIIPIMVIYPFLQKHFAKGILIGAIKG